MDALKNQLPVAVHQVGGGDARVRTGNLVIPLEGMSNGSFSTGTATKIRIFANLRTSGDAVVVLSYTPDPSFANAEFVFDNVQSYTESITGPLNVYWKLLDTALGVDRIGGPTDFLYVTFYE